MLAVVTGANTGMGYEISRSVAAAGYDVVMACHDAEKGMEARNALSAEFPSVRFEVMGLDLADLRSVEAFARKLLERGEGISLLMNNAGSLQSERRYSVDGLEYNVSVNYVGPYLLTRMLLPLLDKGSRIVNMASLVYKFGHIKLENFFTQGCGGSYNRFVVYSNTKLAITLFTIKMAELLKDKGITVNASDPWIVSTEIIRMDNVVVDFLCDKLFRPIIYTPAKGASTAIDLLLNPAKAGQSGTFNKNCHPVKLGPAYLQHPLKDALWNETENVIKDIFGKYGLPTPIPCADAL